MTKLATLIPITATHTAQYTADAIARALQTALDERKRLVNRLAPESPNVDLLLD